MSSSFDHFPSVPDSPLLTDAHVVLASAHASCSSLRQAFVAAGREGQPNEHDQDLLRAMLAFATAGIDAMTKQIVADALAEIIGVQEGARAQFETFLKRRLSRDDGHEMMAKALAASDSRDQLIGALVGELTARSLQSREELSRVGAHFDVPTHEFISDPVALDAVFHARNQISHEMDIDLQGGLDRRERNYADMVSYANTVFRVARDLLREVDARLPVQVP